MQHKSRALAVALAAVTLSLALLATGQSTKGATKSAARPSAYASAPVTQLRQQQQQTSYQQQPAATKGQQVQQQRDDYGDAQSSTEDPLADSEPALYGSVAGAPGVDFPAYTRIPKTSFTCEGKGFDFGFYADEEAQCQVYHVCWSGRRESFLCGVGTVFNQAILACDYWHSVDCSKSSQFYAVNSELGKAGAEPASGSQRPRSPTPAVSPARAVQSYAEPVRPARPSGQQPARQFSPQSQYGADDSFDAPQVPSPAFGTKGVPQAPASQQYERPPAQPTKSAARPPPVARPPPQQPITSTSTQAPPVKRPPASPPAVKAPASAPFSMDFQQKVSSLIDAPVRPPLKSLASKQRANPIVQQQQQVEPQRPANFAQLAVQRAQQSGSQALNQPRKSTAIQNYQQQQQQRDYDSELDQEPEVQRNQQQQQQQLSFDDAPVQTSTTGYGRPSRAGLGSPAASANFPPQQQQLVVQSGGGPDGSSAITTQYDTIGQQQQQPSAGNNYNANAGDSNYESSLDDQSGASDDFRSAGAKAAASHNQNWYIMRSF